uniref:Reverse transcriptase domain-containing protein n=1 Tax=Tanacetum cinerariifolium TaxID=118510 RepID=A0A699J645_TANCI|nr:hypothetical protein [Tanacetum cinerariifolium]
MLIFKVYFEKAFDSVSWRYLDYVLLSLGFGSKCRSWIRDCLQSSRASILINGSPSFEFSIKRGLQQGDPLSPFLFNLAMEGLHGAMSNAVNSGLIRDLDNIIQDWMCCGFHSLHIPRLPIGSNMNLTSSWNILVERFRKRLSSWKPNLLSIGGHLTLIKVVLGSLSIYYLSIFKAPGVILKYLERLCSRFFWAVLKMPRVQRGLNGLMFSLLEKGGLRLSTLPSFKSGIGGCSLPRTLIGLKLLRRCIVKRVAWIIKVVILMALGLGLLILPIFFIRKILFCLIHLISRWVAAPIFVSGKIYGLAIPLFIFDTTGFIDWNKTKTVLSLILLSTVNDTGTGLG